MNAMSKNCLHLVFSGNKPRVGNRQRSSRGLVKWRCKALFDKTCLNILRAKDVRWVGAGLNIEWDNKAGIRKNNKAGIRRVLKLGIERDKKTDAKGDNKVGIGRDNNASTQRDNQAGIRIRDNNEVSKRR